MNTKIDETSIGSLRIFCLSAELESFTKAAQQAEITPTAVSRLISRLETSLNLQLFIRSTRKVRLTELGQRYYQECKAALALLSNAEAELKGEQQFLGGKIKISMPTSYAHYRVLPLLSEFHRLYPNIELDLHISNRNIDFTQEGFDLAIRARTLPDSTLIARHLENAELLVVASPAYLQQHTALKKPEDLNNHSCLEFMLPSTGLSVPWLFKVKNEIVEYKITGKFRCTEDILGPVTLAKNGLGIVQTYRFIIEKELASGELIEVLTAYQGATRPFSLIYPSSAHLPNRTKECIDFLVSRIHTTS
jgi:DNA-binding transcriptional LysR family regulator